jgi:hypothetical protein
MTTVTFDVEDRDETGESGTIEFDPESKAVVINLPISDRRKKEIQGFFSTPRDFFIPESDQIDDFRVDSLVPVDDLGYFKMAMSELYGATGVYVVW